MVLAESSAERSALSNAYPRRAPCQPRGACAHSWQCRPWEFRYAEVRPDAAAIIAADWSGGVAMRTSFR